MVGFVSRRQRQVVEMDEFGGTDEEKNNQELEYLLGLILSEEDESEDKDESNSSVSSENSPILTPSSSSSASDNDFPTTVIKTENITELQPAPKKKKIRKPYKSSRKPSFRVPFIPSLRILKRDVRRKYIDMFFHVMNSHDEQLFSSFLDDFYIPECLTEHTFTKGSQYCLCDLHLQGTDLIKRLHGIHCQTMPDALFLMSNSKICKRLNESGSRIVGNFHTSGTAVYIAKNGCTGKDINKKDLVRRPSLHDKNEMIEFGLADEPLKIDLKGTYIIELDENHRFVSVSFLASECNVSPEKAIELVTCNKR